MSPQTLDQSITINPKPLMDPAQQSFYFWLLSLSAYIQRTYNIFFFPTWNQIATPGVTSAGPFEIDAFYLIAPQFNRPFYIGQMYQALFNNDFASMAAIVLNTVSYPNPAPQPIQAAPVVSVKPPAPSNPIGHPTQNGLEIDYSNLNADLAIGSMYTNTDPTVAPTGTYTLRGKSFGPFGDLKWWVMGITAGVK
jgi:hypothetical protein